jgi:hypothetical protein
MADELVIEIGADEFYQYARDHEHNTRELLDFAQDVADRIVEVARGLAPKRTGRLAAEGIDAEIELVTPNSVRVVAGLRAHPEYGVFVYTGTGIYGEFHRPIVAHRGNVMAYDIDGRHMFSRMVLGQVPHPFIHEALLLVEGTYLPARVRILGEEVT